MSHSSELRATRDWIRSPRFEIREHLGIGGAGVVFRAHDRERGHEVALKVLHDTSARSVRALRREFEALCAFAHPNVVGLGELFDEEEPPFFTMELVRGSDLCSYVRSGERFDEERLRRALAQLTRALRAMHRAGRVHRDIKPQNVRVTEDGRVVVLDLGLSAPALMSVHELAPSAGTAPYMAPEQTRGEVGPEVDFYALGVVLFQCLTGKLPFVGTSEEIALAKETRDAPAPSTLAASLPSDLDALCVALLSRSPSARPNASTVLSALEAGRSARSSSSSFTLSAVPLLGLDEELVRALEACRVGAVRGLDVFITGESGAGKSAFLLALAQKLEHERSGAWVLTDRGEPRPWAAYQGISGIVRQLVDRLKERPAEFLERLLPTDAYLIADLFPMVKRLSAFARLEEGPRPPDRVERRWRAFAAMRAFLCRLAERVPLVFALDDMHWADGDTLQLMAGLVAGERAAVARPRITWLVTADAPLESALGAPAHHVELGPLSATDVRALLLELVDARTRGRLSASPVVMEGALPRAAVETLRHALFFGADAVAFGGSVASMWEQRVDALDGAARRITEICAVAGRPLSLSMLNSCAELEAAQLSAGIGLLRSAGMLEDVRGTDERQLSLTSSCLRSVVLSRIDAELVRELSLRLVSASQGVDQRASACVLRYQLAARHLEAARHTAREAARLAEDVLAFEHAAHVYELASAAWEGEPDDAHRDVLRAMADVLAAAGHSSRAAQAYDRASEGAKVAEALELRRKAAEHWLRGGHIEQGIEQLSQLLSAVGAELPSSNQRALASMLFQRVRIAVRGLQFTRRATRQISARDLTIIDVHSSVGSLIGLVDFVIGADFQTRAVRAALKAGEPRRIAKALCIEAAFSASTEKDPRPRTTHLIAIAQLLADELDDPYLQGLVQLARSAKLFGEVRFREAVESALLGEAFFRERCTSVTWELGQVQQTAVLALMQRGVLDELVQRASTYAREAKERGDLYGWTNIVTVGGFMGPLLEDRADDAEALVSNAMARWPRSGFHVQHFFELLALAQVDLYRGGPEALTRLDAMWPALGKSMLLRVPIIHTSALWMRGLALLASIRARPASRSACSRRLERVIKELEAVPIGHAPGLAALLSAQRDVLEQRPDRALVHVTRALDDIERLDAGLFRERAMYLRGFLLDGDEGRLLCERAVSRLVDMGVASPSHYLRQALPVLEAP